MGATDAIPVQTSTTVIQTTLDDLVGEAYALNVHESAENIGNYIACGNIGGEVAGGSLAIGLAELNDSGYSGIAWLHDNSDGTTTVLVGLTEEYAAAGTPSPEAAAGETAINIANFAFDPPTLSIPAGTTVTWTNQDSAPHTATDTGGAFQSGKLDQGQSYSFTFDTPGTYNYHCEYHANMTATITVT
jgi:plastocyanin